MPCPLVCTQFGIEHVIRMLEGRWKLVILFHLFGGTKLRFSDLERAIPAISQKMLIQRLRQLERDGIVARIVHAQVPPKVEYHLTKWGQSLCPTLDELLTWAERPAAAQFPADVTKLAQTMVAQADPVYGASCVGVGKGSRKWSEEQLKALEIGVVGCFARGCHAGGITQFALLC